MTDALRVFAWRSAGVDMALVFYAGHGLGMNGVHYLVPVDARLEQPTDVRYETVRLDAVLKSMLGAGLRLVILDASFTNPVVGEPPEDEKTRVAYAALGDETLVAFSADVGKVPADGAGRNSPYVAALLAHLEERLEVGMLFRRVREQVLDATDGRQRPRVYHSLLGEHYLGVAP